MKAFKRILMFVVPLVLVFSAVAITGIAADDIQDFIGKDERQRIEEQMHCDQQPICNERPAPRQVNSLQSYNGADHRNDHIAGERLETRFDLAPALQGGTTTSRLQVGHVSTDTGEQTNETQDATQEIEPITDHIPPPNTGRDTYFIRGALGVVTLLGGLLVSRKRVQRRIPVKQ